MMPLQWFRPRNPHQASLTPTLYLHQKRPWSSPIRSPPTKSWYRPRYKPPMLLFNTPPSLAPLRLRMCSTSLIPYPLTAHGSTKEAMVGTGNPRCASSTPNGVPIVIRDDGSTRTVAGIGNPTIPGVGRLSITGAGTGITRTGGYGSPTGFGALRGFTGVKGRFIAAGLPCPPMQYLAPTMA